MPSAAACRLKRTEIETRIIDYVHTHAELSNMLPELTPGLCRPVVTASPNGETAAGRWTFSVRFIQQDKVNRVGPYADYETCEDKRQLFVAIMLQMAHGVPLWDQIRIGDCVN